jgi:DNA-directed RNA polymerase specialized sigma54-like protein
MTQKQTERPIKLKDIEKLLDGQTSAILSAVNGKLAKTDAKMAAMEIRMLSTIDEKIKKSEERINQRIEKLTITLDKFLKRLSDLEDEFAAMKLDINRLKRIIHEKLGIDLI